MEIMFDKCLHDLLVKRGKTQRELAEYLTISTQAVSKWCRGENMPDIALLPKIAAFLDVSVDELLGVGEIRKKEKIHEYRVKSLELSRDGKIDECIEMWREAYAEFPNDLEVSAELMYTLYNGRDEKLYDEALALGERILRESTEERQRSGAIQMLCLIYSSKGNKERAKEYANMANYIHTSRDVLLSQILDGDEGINQNIDLMLQCLDIIATAEATLSVNSDGDRAMQLHEFYLKILELFFDDGFYGIYAMYAEQRHKILARMYLSHRNDEQKAYEHLKKALKFAKQYDNLPNPPSSIVYTSTLLNGHKNKYATFGIYPETECELLLKSLDNAEFDCVREKDWFKDIIAGLTDAE